jgi:hypothetical protein
VLSVRRASALPTGRVEAARPVQVREREAQNQRFGCRVIDMEVNGGSIKGELRCAQAVGLRIPVTGTMKLTGR